MIKWKLPEIEEPGFLRRRLKIAELMDLLPTPENTDKLIDYLSQYVEEGDILDVSQQEYSEILLVLLGLKNSVSDPKGVSSGQQ